VALVVVFFGVRLLLEVIVGTTDCDFRVKELFRSIIIMHKAIKYILPGFTTILFLFLLISFLVLLFLVFNGLFDSFFE
jgi:hypothetical protein